MIPNASPAALRQRLGAGPWPAETALRLLPDAGLLAVAGDGAPLAGLLAALEALPGGATAGVIRCASQVADRLETQDGPALATALLDAQGLLLLAVSLPTPPGAAALAALRCQAEAVLLDAEAAEAVQAWTGRTWLPEQHLLPAVAAPLGCSIAARVLPVLRRASPSWSVPWRILVGEAYRVPRLAAASSADPLVALEELLWVPLSAIAARPGLSVARAFGRDARARWILAIRCEPPGMVLGVDLIPAAGEMPLAGFSHAGPGLFTLDAALLGNAAPQVLATSRTRLACADGSVVLEP
jgi:hypothetical protein